MAGDCCGDVKFDGVSAAYKRALWAVIAINGTMFFVEMAAGLSAQSMALKADALDFLGDTVTYFISFLVIGQPLLMRARVAFFKGLSLGVFALVILGGTLYRVLVTGEPDGMVMGKIGALAFAANVLSVLILLKFRDGDSNVRSVWLCSRNDAIGNLAVIGAAFAVASTGSAWPDLLVAVVLAGLFLTSAVKIISQSREEMREERRHLSGHNEITASGASGS
jgi:Co/Zn/Cd efflux system component